MNAVALPGARDIPHWVAGYIGLPFTDHGRGPEAFDCWGLVRFVLDKRFGIRCLPEHGGYVSCGHRRSVAEAFRHGLAESWRQVPAEQHRAGDIAVFSVGRLPSHVGLVVSQDTMLHIEKGTDSVVERFDRQPWVNRIEGVYRHVSIA